jgi:hypothetical protein
MILASALGIWLATKKHYVWGGVAIGLGVLARHLTAIACGGLLGAQIEQRVWRPKAFFRSWSVAALAVPLVVFSPYLFFMAKNFGDPLMFVKAREAGWGPMAWWGALHVLFSPNPDHIFVSYMPFALVPTLGTIVLLRQRQLPLTGFAVPFLLLIWGVGAYGLGRYSAACWPGFLGLGIWLEKRPTWAGPLLGALALFQGLYFFLFSHQFPIL